VPCPDLPDRGGSDHSPTGCPQGKLSRHRYGIDIAALPFVNVNALGRLRRRKITDQARERLAFSPQLAAAGKDASGQSALRSFAVFANIGACPRTWRRDRPRRNGFLSEIHSSSRRRGCAAGKRMTSRPFVSTRMSTRARPSHSIDSFLEQFQGRAVKGRVVEGPSAPRGTINDVAL